MANDMQVQHDVLVALDGQANVIAGTIGVEVHHGVVKLAGRVSDYAIKTDVERVTSLVDNVRVVILDIGVGGAERIGRPRIV
jgi:osmotically-inducible protein OsmY